MNVLGALRMAGDRLLGRGPDMTEMPELLAHGDRRGPDFICIGAQKGGTRWLFDQLNHHPDFWMPPIKELHYFNENIHLKWAEPLFSKARYGRGRLNRKLERSQMRALDDVDVEWLRALMWLHGKPIDFDLYSRLFSPKGERLSGDITPTYAIIAEEKVKAACANLPEAKIVYLVREPIERFWSHYCMIARQQKFENAADLATVEDFIRTGSGVRHSSPTKNVARWKEAGAEGRFGLFFFDELRTDPAGLRASIVGFLGGDPGKASGTLPPGFNRKSKDPKVVMSDRVRDHLIDLLGGEIRAAATEFGGPAREWPRKYGL
ncbi:MAG: sulfotransferase [Bauldia sp.]|uniref:sulfotransferase n=1 Tax=Bauldia sp. TaxID=2575872 RepID=UPI001D35BCA5|nr:sulfotransferase [Bauldia sp.]MCB1494776.1 sulfotransferase [Bauldia sp.]